MPMYTQSINKALARRSMEDRQNNIEMCEVTLVTKGPFVVHILRSSLPLGRPRLNDCSMKHYIVLNIALFSHAHVTISAEINLTHACSRGEASRSNCHSRLRAFVGMASWNWETVLKV